MTRCFDFKAAAASLLTAHQQLYDVDASVWITLQATGQNTSLGGVATKYQPSTLPVFSALQPTASLTYVNLRGPSAVPTWIAKTFGSNGLGSPAAWGT